jgi:putative transposase
LRQGTVLNKYGEIAQEEWLLCKHLRREVDLGAFVIMPDHLHGIVMITVTEGSTRRALIETTTKIWTLHRPPRSLGALIAGFKSSTTKRINLVRNSPGTVVWQSNYHEHVIRSDKELAAISRYIIANPLHAARRLQK